MPQRLRAIARGCLVPFAIALVVALLGGVVLRRALDPARFRGVAESRLTALLGRPVRIDSMRIAFVPIPSLVARRVTVGETAAGAPSIALETVRIFPRLRSIFSTPIVVQRVELDGLAVHVLRDRTGRWLLPFAAAGAATVAGGASQDGATDRVEIEEVVLRNGLLALHEQDDGSARTPHAAALRDITATLSRQGATTTLERISGRFGSSAISGAGNASRDGLRLSLTWDAIHTADLPQLFALFGTAPPRGLVVEGRQPLTLDLLVDPKGTPSATGRVAASRIAFGTLSLSSLQTPLRLDDQVLTLQPVTFSAFGADGRGTFGANLAADPVGWRFSGRLPGMDVGQLIDANTSARDTLEGRGDVAADVTGTSAAPMSSLAGTFTVVVTDGVIRNLPLLTAINSALKVSGTGGRDTPFERLSATFQVARRRMSTNDVRLQAGELTARGEADIGFDQQLSARAQAIFSRDKSQELIARVHELAGLKNEAGEIVVPFTVSGTVSTPRVEVDVAALAGRAIQKELRQQLDRRLKRFFERRNGEPPR